MAEYIPSPRDWVREQVEIYERTNGAEGNTLRDTGLPVIIVAHVGNKTGAIRKTLVMRVKDGANYTLVGSPGGAPKDPVWVRNLRANPQVELRDLAVVSEDAGTGGHRRDGARALVEGRRGGLSAVRGVSNSNGPDISGLRG
jgi:deazaflavin-dependent oxidoreductase (nitroreductase family)